MYKQIKVLALDLEGTLISNAMSQIPRPGLHEFLEKVSKIFERLVIFTTVREEKFREIATLLCSEGAAPSWFREIEYINWSGKTKNLEFIHGVEVDQVLLVDDFPEYIHQGQESQWVKVKHFDYPYSGDDGLAEVYDVLKRYGT